MKIIELLNKIANGEEFPNIIKYKDIVFDYKKEKGDYESEGEQFFLDWVELNKYGLNDDVRAIELCHKCHKYPAEYNQTYCEFCLGISEEDKKIKTIDPIDYCRSTDTSKDMVLVEKINEIIRFLYKTEKDK